MIEVAGAAGHAALFCSDMHLGDHDPRTAAFFLDRLMAAADGVSHLFLLGDLFEVWVGDDQPDAASAALIERLAALERAGTQVFVMRGNRDFLLDVPLPAQAGVQRHFSERAQVVMLDDPCTVRLFDRQVLLAHGDALCTDDVGYQRIRAVVRNRRWQDDMLAKPLDERLRIGRELRGESERVKADRALTEDKPGDVNDEAVAAAMRAAGVDVLIHGHTHRPACHRVLIDGKPAQRWVLSDWHAPARGSFLRVDAAGWRVLEAEPMAAA